MIKMSNKIQLQTNNTALDTLITRVNAAKDVAASLPDAGGGSTEACTVTLSPTLSLLRLIYQSPDGILHHYDDMQGLGTVEFPASFTVNKNSLVIIEEDSPEVTLTGANMLATIDSSYLTRLRLIQIIETTATIDGYKGG